MKRKIGILFTVGVALLVMVSYFVWHRWMSPTRILIVNPLPSQAADIALNNDCADIRVTCIPMEELADVSAYDAIMMYGRGLFLNDAQVAELEKAAAKGVPIFTNSLRNFNFIVNYNLSKEQIKGLEAYYQNACRQNYRNVLRYMRELATPYKWGDHDFDPPFHLPKNMYYHLEYGQYFETEGQLTEYLQKNHLYHENGRKVGLLSGVTFPTEGNRAHVDTLISRLTQAGFNVYPMTSSGKAREKMIRSLHPDAMVYLPMGRLGNDSLIQWLYQENTLLFMPYPLMQSHEEWTDANKPVIGGTLTARVVIPEIDGAIAPLCISTLNENKEGYFIYTPEPERVNSFMNLFTRQMRLREMPNREKRVAICYFKTPGKDALLASGMEVAPSIYNFLKRLQREGYRVDGLPATEEAFEKELNRKGSVMGSYAKGAQETFLKTGDPVWLSTRQYETWAKETLLPHKYKEVTDRYGAAPGGLLATPDSIAVACLQYGNILLFPQPRPALGEDEFKLVHGMPVAPPHSYLASYLYMKKGFKADALIHFGTHGNLEYTPGKNVGLSQADWPEVLVGNLPHFYFYTTGNVGEGIIAKRRTHAELVTYLTPPYAESGMRQRYSTLLDGIHKLLDNDLKGLPSLELQVKEEAMRLGLSRDLGLDSIPDKPYTREELEQLDAFAEEIANEKTIGAYYTMGEPYSPEELRVTTMAVAADPLAYEYAKRDRDKGIITTEQLQDFKYVAHHYLPKAQAQLKALLQNLPEDAMEVAPELRPALLYREQLLASTVNEMDAMVKALGGGVIYPAPGGDPVLNPNVLPTGRNMYSINAEMAPNPRAWEDGKRLAEATIEQYRNKHGEYPRKVSYTFWAGEFITTEGATLAQAFWMLGIEPVRDNQGRVVDLKLIPSEELGRPRINVVIQISGQLRDIAGSCLKLLTDAVRLASESPDEAYPNYVASGTLLQEKTLMDKGIAPKEARKMSIMRVFGPVNSGYSTGILGYTESSGSWEDEKEIAEGFLNNMGATYGDDENWGSFQKDLFASALTETDVVIQPRQSNTWGPISLDHVYEFTGGLSLTVKTVTGKEPDAYMADYRNRNNRRLQEAKEAISVETRSTILNPTFIQERMKGGAGTAQMFGEIFRNIFGWNVTRPSALDKELFNDLYKMYVEDENHLGIYEYFSRVNPASYQSMTAVLLESARKGYWKATQEQLEKTAGLHAKMTTEQGAACTEFVCGNDKLRSYVANQLEGPAKESYARVMKSTLEKSAGKEVILKEQKMEAGQQLKKSQRNGIIIGALVCVAFVALAFLVRKRNKQEG